MRFLRMAIGATLRADGTPTARGSFSGIDGIARVHGDHGPTPKRLPVRRASGDKFAFLVAAPTEHTDQLGGD